MEQCPLYQKVVGSIPSQSTCLDISGVQSPVGRYWRQPVDVSLPFSLSKSINICSGEDFKKGRHSKMTHRDTTYTQSTPTMPCLSSLATQVIKAWEPGREHQPATSGCPRRGWDGERAHQGPSLNLDLICVLIKLTGSHTSMCLFVCLFIWLA